MNGASFRQASLTVAKVTVGRGLTVTVTLVAPLHPKVVPVTMYVTVEFGEADTTGVLEEESPIVGTQVYEAAPLAVSVTLSPAHMAGEAGVTVTTGLGLTVTVVCAEAVHEN